MADAPPRPTVEDGFEVGDAPPDKVADVLKEVAVPAEVVAVPEEVVVVPAEVVAIPAEVPGGAGPELEDLPAEVVMRIFEQCSDFKQLSRFRKSSAHFFNVFQDSSNTILTNMARRTLGEAVELAKEVLVYQRHTMRGIPNFTAARVDFAAMKATSGSVILRITDIQQLLDNHMFYLAFRRHYRQVVPYMAYTKVVLRNSLLTEKLIDPMVETHDRENSVDYEVGLDVTMMEFYKTWLLIWRFRYETVGEFVEHEFITPEETGQLHFIAFVMEYCRHCEPYIRSYSENRVPDAITGDNRLAANRSRILNGWRQKSLMGIWYPLKLHKTGMFSKKWFEGVWKVATQKGLKGFTYFSAGEWGVFTTQKGGSHLIYWKMLCHLAIAAAAQGGAADVWHDRFIVTKRLFDVDFENLTTAELIAKYEF